MPNDGIVIMTNVTVHNIYPTSFCIIFTLKKKYCIKAILDNNAIQFSP